MTGLGRFLPFDAFRADSLHCMTMLQCDRRESAKSCRLETISTCSLPFIVAQMTTQLHSCMFNFVVHSLIVVLISQGEL